MDARFVLAGLDGQCSDLFLEINCASFGKQSGSLESGNGLGLLSQRSFVVHFLGTEGRGLETMGSGGEDIN